MSQIVNLQKLFIKNGEASHIKSGKIYTGIIPDEGIPVVGRSVVLYTPDGKTRMNTSPVKKILEKNAEHVLLETNTSIYLLKYLES